MAGWIERSKAILAGTVGNALEWYDFAVYGYLAAIIGRHFFPEASPTAQVLAAFGVFALGFLMRPIGGILIGHIGDRHGRRMALTVSVAGMAVPTFLIGVLPTYAAIGVAAPILLTLLRMLQGLAVGGEYTSSMVFLVEHAPAYRRGLMGAFVVVGAIGGILIGSATAAVLAASVSEETLDAWGWRIPFLLGLLVGGFGYVVRRQFLDVMPAPHKGAGTPIVEVVSSHWRMVLKLIGTAVFNSVVFYLIFVFVASWVQRVDGIAPATALEINTANMALTLPLMIVAGLVSDRIGRKPVLIAAAAFAFIAAWPLFRLMHHPDALLVFLGQLGFVFAVGIYLGAQPSMMVEAVPAAVRCSALALSYNLCLALIGGTAPLVATWLVERTGDAMAPAFYVMAAAAVAMLAVASLRETYRAPLPE